MIELACGILFGIGVGYVVGTMFAWREMRDRNEQVAENMAFVNKQFSMFCDAQKEVLHSYADKAMPVDPNEETKEVRLGDCRCNTARTVKEVIADDGKIRYECNICGKLTELRNG